MSLSIGESVVSARYESEVFLSSDLLQLSQTVQMVCREATNGYVLSGMVLGPLAGIALKCKSLSLFSHFFKDSKIASFAFKPLASGIGLLGEGGIIHFTPALLQTGSFGPNAFNGSLSSTLTIMACKMTTKFGLPPNVVMNHMVQNCAIMGAQEVSGILGLSERVHGNWMMRFSEAEVSNIQISAGMSIVHGTAHGIRYMEATFQVQTSVRGSFNLFQGIRKLFAPARQVATDQNILLAMSEFALGEHEAAQARERVAGLKMVGSGERGNLARTSLNHLYQMRLVSNTLGTDHPAYEIIFHEQSGGFPGIVQGGIIADVGMRLLTSYIREIPLESYPSGLNELFLENDLTASLRGRIVPGETYYAIVSEEGGRFSVQFHSPENFSAESKPLATVQRSPFDQGGPDSRSDLLSLGEAGNFRCIDSCVVFGAHNSQGLDLTPRYSKSSAGEVDRLWIDLPAAEVETIVPPLDELGWWMGAIVSGRSGITTKLNLKFLRLLNISHPNTRLRIVAERPSSEMAKKRIIKVPILVINQDTGKFLVSGEIDYMPNREAAKTGMGESGDVSHLEVVLGQLRS